MMRHPVDLRASVLDKLHALDREYGDIAKVPDLEWAAWLNALSPAEFVEFMKWFQERREEDERASQSAVQ